MLPTPQATSTPSSDTKSPTGRYFLGALAATFFILILRRPDAVYNPQFWAEDATVFFQDAFTLHAPSSLFKPYAGYFHLVPRTVAWIANALVSPEWLPHVYNFTAIPIAAFCLALFSHAQFRRLMPSDGLRFLVCCFVALAHPGTEIINTLTNVHWYLTLASLLLLFWPVQSRRAVIAIVLFQIVAGLSCPLNLFLVPLAIGLLIARRREHRAAAIALTATMTIHIALAAILVKSTDRRPMYFDLPRLAEQLADAARTLLLYATTGYNLGGWLNNNAVVITWIWTALVACAGLFLFFRPSSSADRLRAIIAIGLATTWIAAYIIVDSPAHPPPNHFFNDVRQTHFTRCFFMPYCMLIYLVARTWELHRPTRSFPQAIMQTAVAIFLIAGLAGGLRPRPFADLHWPESVREAQHTGWRSRILINPNDK